MITSRTTRTGKKVPLRQSKNILDARNVSKTIENKRLTSKTPATKMATNRDEKLRSTLTNIGLGKRSDVTRPMNNPKPQSLRAPKSGRVKKK